MEKFIFTLCFIFFAISSYSQNEKTVLGEFCYYEQLDGKGNPEKATPYTYHDRIELKFNSGYQITIKTEEKNDLIKILESHKKKGTKTRLGNYKPEVISGILDTKGKYSSIIDNKKYIEFFYDGNNILIEIPELTDMFGSGTVSNHTIFLPKKCVKNLIDCLKK
ncbi:hypothetical protein QNI16_36315 [Cytophagaceae bacterium YF14B1]|uniref:Uncharacterized protein n=1 Tax=Xanthocytophaga flava TaxID=3048013 RepID=A0AAE3UCZ0_9BACT|nr:hypothetical protein [Xanthocytophaga flavus]MDJ1486003.1 hypothetical protein [Xanthocytophaga flavus]